MKRKRPSRPRVKLNPLAVWELLDQLGISQKELARRSGISAGYLSQLIRGERSPSVRIQGRLQQALGVTDWDRCSSWNPPVRTAPTRRRPRPKLEKGHKHG